MHRCWFCPARSNLPTAPRSEGLCDSCIELLYDFRVYLDGKRREWHDAYLVVLP